MVYKCLHGEAPAYLSEMQELRLNNPALHRLRNTANLGPGTLSSTGNLGPGTKSWTGLVVTCSRLKTFGPRSFATTGPSLGHRHSRSDSKYFYLNNLSWTNRDIIPAARVPLRWPCYKETLYKCPKHYITFTLQMA